MAAGAFAFRVLKARHLHPVGYVGEDDLPTLYIGQGDGIRNRIEAHYGQKEFRHWGFAFVSHSAGGGLSRAHITWLEYKLIERATRARRSRLENGNAPSEPALSEAEKADTQGFLNEMLQILPLVGLRAFDEPRPVAMPMAHTPPLVAIGERAQELDTVIVPAQREGFDAVFLGEKAWRAIRISGGMLPKIKYVAAYQTQPVSAVTHVAPVARIEPYGEGGKYQLFFSEPPQPIPPIPFGAAPQGAMQGPRYVSLNKLKAAMTLAVVFLK